MVSGFEFSVAHLHAAVAKVSPEFDYSTNSVEPHRTHRDDEWRMLVLDWREKSGLCRCMDTSVLASLVGVCVCEVKNVSDATKAHRTRVRSSQSAVSRD